MFRGQDEKGCEADREKLERSLSHHEAVQCEAMICLAAFFG